MSINYLELANRNVIYFQWFIKKQKNKKLYYLRDINSTLFL